MQSTDKTNLASNMNYNHLQMAIEIKREDVKAISVKLKRLTDKHREQNIYFSSWQRKIMLNLHWDKE